MDERYWETWNGKDGYPLHYAEIAASSRTQEIMIRAQANLTELGYWRDVATDLADLIDTVSDIARKARYAMLDGAISDGDVPTAAVDAWLRSIQEMTG